MLGQTKLRLARQSKYNNNYKSVVADDDSSELFIFNPKGAKNSGVRNSKFGNTQENSLS